MIQMELFRKREGMIQSASADRYHLERAREIANHLGDIGVQVDIDMVREYAERAGDPLPSGNYLGSTFSGWRMAGFKSATHKGSHGRTIKTWVKNVR